MNDLYADSVLYHTKNQGKLGTTSLVGELERSTLSLAYTPGVAEPCRIIAKDNAEAYDLTLKGRTIAVISNGSAVLGLGDIGAVAGLPVMEGKALLLKQFGQVDAFPLVIDAAEPQQIIDFVKAVSPTFAGINLEDITAPVCFEVEEALQDIGVPVFHDDQHGTAIVVRAALINAAKVVGKPFESLKVVIVGAGAAGLAITKMLLGLTCNAEECTLLQNTTRVKDVIVVDTQGALVIGRNHQNVYKQAIAGLSNNDRLTGDLQTVIRGADVVIGVSKPNSITPDMIKLMNHNAIVFSLANPTPEIMPDVAKSAGAAIVATGRSDFANQINNVLAFPGIFKAVVQGRLKTITPEMKLAASDAIAALITDPSPENIIPSVFYPRLATIVANAVLSSVTV